MLISLVCIRWFVYNRDTDTRSQMAICSRYHSDVSDQPKKQTSEAKALKKELQMAEEYAVYLSDLQNHPQYTNNLKGQNNMYVLLTCTVSWEKIVKLRIHAISC